MQPDEYRVCVTGGYPIDRRAGSGFEAEAIVYIWGGRTGRAQAWIAADDEARAAMQACERRTTWVRGDFWRRWWADGA